MAQYDANVSKPSPERFAFWGANETLRVSSTPAANAVVSSGCIAFRTADAIPPVRKQTGFLALLT